MVKTLSRLWPAALVFFLTALSVGTTFGQAELPLQPLRDSVQLVSSADLSAAPGSVAGSKTYIVMLADRPVVSYEGEIKGYAATKPKKGQKINPNSGKVSKYKGYLDSKHDELLASIAASGKKKYSYGYSFNGFAAELTAGQVVALKKRGDVLAVWEDELRDIETNYTPDFLGLNDPGKGLAANLGLTGEDVIIGIIDTGVWPEHPSFDDRVGSNPKGKEGKLGYQQIPGWHGKCVPGEDFNASHCNQKLIGAHYYSTGFLSFSPIEDADFLSPRDSSGHGSHTASTAGGNGDIQPTFNGQEIGPRIAGMAPRARISSYKTCWVAPGASNFSCAGSDLQAAIDQAVADGVDVINYSIGSSSTGLIGPDDIAFLFAADAGVFVATSNGNSGPEPNTIGSPAGVPWVTSVGASTRDGERVVLGIEVSEPAEVAGEYSAVEGAITRPLKETGEVSGPLTAAVPLLACDPLTNELDGQVALIARGACAFDVKLTNAVNAGAIAVVVYSTGEKITMGGSLSFDIPGVMIDLSDGLAIAEAIGDGSGAVTLGPDTFTTEPTIGNQMAGFSSRGPNGSAFDIIKPDVTAPGVAILAATTPEQSASGGVQGELYEYLQGTSMSSPHVAGIGALLKEAHPDWSPAAIRSALVTSARQDVTKEDGVTPADPFDYGGGHIVPNAAVDPGLVYDADLFDYLAFLCGAEPDFVGEDLCAAVGSLGYSFDASDLNYPSIGISKLAGVQTVTRRVTNVGVADTYSAVVNAPAGIDVSVSPIALELDEGETGEFTVTFTATEAVVTGQWLFGDLTWTSGTIDVRSPIAVRALGIDTVDELSLNGTEGSTSFDVTFGYSGDYLAGVHGLNLPAGLDVDGDGSIFDSVPDDPANSYEFLGDGTITTAFGFLSDTAAFRVSLLDELTSAGADLDLYLHECLAGLGCNPSPLAFSGNFTSDEEITLSLVNGLKSLDGDGVFYALAVHGYETGLNEEGEAIATTITLIWDIGLVDDADNMTVTAPGAATIGETETITVDWAGLSGGTKYFGAVSHITPGGVEALTIIDVNTGLETE